jgi:Tol biopolymer transport system component
MLRTSTTQLIDEIARRILYEQKHLPHANGSKCTSIARKAKRMSFKKVIAMLLLATVVSGSLWADSDRDGRGRIVFSQGSDVYSMKPDGTDVRQLTHVGANTSAQLAAWSPDAKQIVFSEYPPAGPTQLWLMNADGSNQHQLFNDPFNDYFPSFSPNGSHIAFTRCQTTSNGTCAIYRVRTDGTGMTAITDFQPEIFDIAPVYSPDGETIAFGGFNRGGVLGAIYLMEADGSEIRRLTPTELGAQQPFWSPDGESIAFQTHCCNPQNAEIWTINRGGHELTRLTGSAASDLDIPVAHYNQNPSWSPQGKAIVFGQYLPSSNISAIFITNADGSECTQIRVLPPSPLKMDASPWKKRRRALHEIEKGGSDPRWSPAQW